MHRLVQIAINKVMRELLNPVQDQPQGNRIRMVAAFERLAAQSFSFSACIASVLPDKLMRTAPKLQFS